MRSIPQTLTWEMRRNCWWILGFFLLGNLLPMLVLGALSPYEIDPDDTALLLMHVVFLPLIMFSFGGGIAEAQGPMSQLYSKPISTTTLVAWHMFPGAILLATEVAVAGWMYRTHYSWPILGPSIFAAAAWASLQVLVSVSQRSLTSFCLAVSPAAILFSWLHSRYGGWFSQPTHYWTNVTPSEIATMLGVIVVSYFVTIVAIKRDRCGEPMPSLGGRKWIRKRWESLAAKSPITAKPFPSPAAAQFWYDWTLKGWAMPLIVVLGYSVLFSTSCAQFIAGSMTADPVQAFHKANLAAGAMIGFLAGIVGLLVGVSASSNSGRNHKPTIHDLFGKNNSEDMGHFLSTRPITNSDMANAFLRMVRRSLLITWAIWSTMFFGGLLVAYAMRRLPSAVFPSHTGAWYLPLIMLGSWISMANLATIGLTGRGTKLSFAIVTGVITCVIGEIIIRERCTTDVQQIIYEASIWIISISILFVTPLLLRKAHRNHLLSLKAPYVLSGVFLAIVILVMAFEARVLPILAYPMILAFSALVVLPLATIPLAIRWNRHR